MFAFFANFFIMLTKFVSAGTRVANSVDSIAETLEDRANAFRDEQKLEIAAKRIELEAKLANTDKPTKSSEDFDL